MTRRPSTTSVPAAGARSRQRGFTLLELLLAIAVFAVILAAINGVFWGALRLRNKTSRMLEDSVAVQQALTILRRDLAGIVLPGGTFAGQLLTDTSSLTAETGQMVSPEFHTNTGGVDEVLPWGDFQKVAYYLRTPTNRVSGRDGGFDLIRVVTRNLSPALQEEPIDQWLMTGVEQMQFSYYDGTSWRTSWNSTNETTVLPRAIRVQIAMALPDASQLGQDRSVRITRSPIELVVPILVTASTNTTQTASTQ